MATTTPNQIYTQGTGTTSTDAFLTVFVAGAPSINTVNFPVGKRWVDTDTSVEYILENFYSSNGQVYANWIALSSSGGSELKTLTGNSGGAVSGDSSQNINTVGDGTTINTIGNPGTHTLTSNVILPAQYDVLASDVSSIAGISPSTLGFVLTSNGPGALPTFQANGSGDLSTLTPDSGGVVSPVSGNIDVTGYPQTPTTLVKGIKTYNGGTNVFEIANLLASTPYVVGKNANTYHYTSIQTAINNAVTDGASAANPLVVLITPGTYTENLTLSSHVYLVGVMDGNSNAVVIEGNADYTPLISSPDLVLENLEFTCSSGVNSLSMSQGSAGNVYLNNLTITGTPSQGCLGLELTAFTVNIKNSRIIGTASSAPIYQTLGTINIYDSIITYAGTGSTFIGTGGGNYYGCTIVDSISGGSSTLAFYNCTFSSLGVDACIASAGINIFAYHTIFSSANAAGNFITALGSTNVTYADIVATGTATKIENTATLVGNVNQCGNISFDGGATTLSANGQLWIGATSGIPVPATLTAGPGISITNAANSITIGASAGGVAWSSEAASFSAADSHGYLVTATATATLPTGAANGSTIEFISNITTGSGVITIQAAAGDFISISAVSGAAAGSAVSTQYGDSLTLVYIATELTWYATSVIGNWTVS